MAVISEPICLFVAALITFATTLLITLPAEASTPTVIFVALFLSIVAVAPSVEPMLFGVTSDFVSVEGATVTLDFVVSTSRV